jgi:PhoPQ-activated pathogenicity-related protein
MDGVEGNNHQDNFLWADTFGFPTNPRHTLKRQRSQRTLFLAGFLGLALLFARPAPAGDVLANYVAAPDSSYGWYKRSEGRYRDVSYMELIMTSQTWRDIAWKHQLYIIRPEKLNPDNRHALLLIYKGKWRSRLERPPVDEELPKNVELFRQIANRMQTPVAIVRQVPFQPMFGGMTEDTIIAHTFDQYLQTGDSSWLLLLPMVKASVRAMDAVQEFTAQQWAMNIETFTVAGASKRGWTAWLTAAADDRVTALAPMAIDVLDIKSQLNHQKAVWGALSSEVSDYADLDLPDRLLSDAGRALLEIVDPYFYRERITQPKLIIVGTNDPYWPLDALNLYWDELSGPKYVLYIPNDVHSLEDYGRLIPSVNALHQHAATGATLPQLTSRCNAPAERLILRAWSDPAPAKIQAWTATSPTRDFRNARWKSTPIRRTGDVYVFGLERPNTGYVAAFGELWFGNGSAAYPLSTTVCIAAGMADSDLAAHR